jgi:hypothetical protein
LSGKGQAKRLTPSISRKQTVAVDPDAISTLYEGNPDTILQWKRRSETASRNQQNKSCYGKQMPHYDGTTFRLKTFGHTAKKNKEMEEASLLAYKSWQLICLTFIKHTH